MPACVLFYTIQAFVNHLKNVLVLAGIKLIFVFTLPFCLLFAVINLNWKLIMVSNLFSLSDFLRIKTSSPLSGHLITISLWDLKCTHSGSYSLAWWYICVYKRNIAAMPDGSLKVLECFYPIWSLHLLNDYNKKTTSELSGHNYGSFNCNINRQKKLYLSPLSQNQ